MILFGKVVMPNMFSAESPAFHYNIAETLVDKSVLEDLGEYKELTLEDIFGY